MMKYSIGVDIGGSHISAVLINIEETLLVPGSFVSSQVDNHAPANEIIRNWAATLQKIQKEINPTQLAGIGFAMPGPFDYEKGIALFTPQVAKYENLYGIDVAHEIRNLLNLPQETPLRFLNDATSFAVGEAWFGKSSGNKKSIAITLGTGFGSAFIESGLPVLERNDVPRFGNFWHLPFKEGIADDYFSTRWFVLRYTELTGEVLSGVKEIAKQAEKDTLIRNVFEEFGRNLGEFIGPWAKSFGAESIVIGGNMTGAWNLFGETFSGTMKRLNVEINIYLSELGQTSAMIGSARLMDESFWSRIKPLYCNM